MTVKEFLESNNKEDIQVLTGIKTGLKGRNVIGGKTTKEFLEYPFWKLLNARKYSGEGKILELCSLTLGIGFKELLNRPYQELVYYLKFVEEQFEKIRILESNLSKGGDVEEEMKLEMAGISEMTKFEELNIIDELAGGDMLKWEAIQRLPYKTIYVKLLRNRTKSNIQSKFQKLNLKK